MKIYHDGVIWVYGNSPEEAAENYENEIGHPYYGDLDGIVFELYEKDTLLVGFEDEKDIPKCLNVPEAEWGDDETWNYSITLPVSVWESLAEKYIEETGCYVIATNEW